jgi:cytochrome c553
MRWFPSLSLIASLAVLGACSTQTTAPSAPEPSQLELCFACHYVEGASAGPEFPNIAGQYETYLVKAVQNYKEGKRDSETMQYIASLHTEAELTKLARYFSMLPAAGHPANASVDRALWERGRQIYQKERIYGISCADCHGDNGMGYQWKTPRMKAARAIPRLAGQRREYLATALQKYVEGNELSGMCTMRKAGKTLSEGDVKALVEYLGTL